MTKLVNCEIELSQESQKAIHSIEYIENGYTIELNYGYMFSWETTCTHEICLDDVLKSINSIEKISNEIADTLEYFQ